MCGFVGVFDTRSRREVPRDVVRRMNESLHHRGPDECGLHLEPGLGLGHKRLSIIDLSTGQQPLYNEDRSVVVVFNGEIYNYADLIPILTALGHTFHTRSDTEVIVHAWETWGEQCVERFRGMFAFALWDSRQEKLFLARDRLGVKPLFHAQLPDGMFIFGSELKSLLAYGGMSREMEPCAIEDYFSLGYIPEPRTIFRQAQKLSSAHTLSLTRGEAVSRPKKYWDLRFAEQIEISDQDAEAELVERLREAVRVRLISEVPLGAFLSGGVDSSAVVAMMAEAETKKVMACSVSFAQAEYDESAFAREVARRYDARHFVDRVESDCLDVMDKLPALYDEPFADSSALPTYRVCELARRHVTVALSGDGGDEAFAGYTRQRLQLRHEKIRSFLPGGGRRLIALLGQVYPQVDWAPRPLRAKFTLQALGRPSVEAYFHGVSLVKEQLRAELFSDRLKKDLSGYSGFEVFRQHAERAPTDDPLSLIQYLDFHTYLIDDINTKVDRASMAHSLEVREPLMDHPLVEWAASLPPRLKIRGGEGKYLLKKAMEPFLSRDLLYRPKMGFAVPVGRWFRGPLRERVRRVLLGESLAGTGLFNQSCLARIVEQHEKGHRNHTNTIWTLLMFDGFLRNSTGPDKS